MTKTACIVALAAILLVLARPGATPAVGGEPVMAMVNGESVTRADVRARIARIHRYVPRIEAKGEARGVDVRGIVRSLVERRLLIQEARRLGLNRHAYVLGDMERFRREQAVIAFRRAEVLERAVVDEAEVEKVFQDNSGHGDLDEEQARRVRLRIRKGLERQAVRRLTADVERRLREGAVIRVDEAWLAAMPLDGEPADPGYVVAEVDGQKVTAADLVREMRLNPKMRSSMFRHAGGQAEDDGWAQSLKRDAVDHIVICLLVEAEAMDRGFGDADAVREAVAAHGEDLLVAVMEREIIAPLATPTGEQVERYHAAHRDEFRAGSRIRLARMRFRDQGRARRIREELGQGADFEFLARQESLGPDPGDGSWLDEAALPAPLREALKGLEPFGVTPVVPVGREFVVAKLRARKGGEPLPLERVEPEVRRVVARLNYERVREEYLAKLMDTADVRVDEEALAGLEKTCWAETGQASGSDGEEP